MFSVDLAEYIFRYSITADCAAFSILFRVQVHGIYTCEIDKLAGCRIQYVDFEADNSHIVMA
jgi:hypothetical protein